MPHIAPHADTLGYRAALGHFATGVTIVTTLRGDGAPIGLTANSFSSVSLAPPLVLWSLATRSPSLLAFSNAAHYAINVLAADQQVLSQRFATPLPDKFAGVALQPGPGGVPLIEGATMQLICEHHQRIPAGDHVIFIGQVLGYHVRAIDPLIYCRGRYLAESLVAPWPASEAAKC
jgi:3-hydroxy-9,10-secoandrosta-1,3,5(10)-triene-9,17-dione monooxygenase reductase component